MGDLKVQKASSWIPALQSQSKLWFTNARQTPTDHDRSEQNSTHSSAIALTADPIWSQAWVQRLCSQCQQQQDEPQAQTQLTIGQVGDPYELEADAIADKVMSMPDPQPTQIQRQSDDLDSEASEEEPTIQAKSLYSSIYQRVQRQVQGSSRVGADLESRLSHSKSSGSPLPDHVQAFMGSRLGADLSPIRVHTDATAVQMNQELGAQAFAHGHHVYYGAGNGPANDHLTAHELTHTIQQGAVVRTSPDTTFKQQVSTTRIQRQTATPNPACRGTNRNAGVEHELIQADYIATKDPTGAREYSIPGGSTGGNVGYADLVSQSTYAIYEIKPYTPDNITAGLAQVNGYLQAARTNCDPTAPWHLGNAYPDTVLPLGVDRELVAKQYGNPGLILYYTRRKQRQPNPVPVPVPVPGQVPGREQEPTPVPVPGGEQQPVPVPTPEPGRQPQPAPGPAITWESVFELLVVLGLSIALVAVVLYALLSPEPATKLAAAGLSAAMIAAILTHFGLEDEREGGNEA